MEESYILNLKLSLFSLFYFFLSAVLYILALPLLFYLSFKQKYKHSIPARFFLYKNRPLEGGDIWFHVCSLGEARALKPLLDTLSAKKISITTITQTGQAEAKKYKKDTRYLPYEMFLPFWVKKHKFLVVLEAEFWFMLFLVAKLKGSRVVLLNGRISSKSAKSYLRFKWFYKIILSMVEVVFAQSASDRELFLTLGAKDVRVIGNIKLAGAITKTKDYVKPKAKLIVAASTHKDEEELILRAFLEYKKTQKDVKLVVVPRHPERFSEVYELLLKSSLSVKKFSLKKDFQADITLVDMMGELNNIYAISDVAILGGAFRDDVGGHNPLEPAFFGCKIVSGEHFFNQKELFKYVKNLQIVKNSEILEALLSNSEPCRVDEQIDLSQVMELLDGTSI